jgi:hypothetical protein
MPRVAVARPLAVAPALLTTSWLALPSDASQASDVARTRTLRGFERWTVKTLQDRPGCCPFAPSRSATS